MTALSPVASGEAACAERPLDGWVHVPTPGDHYSPRTGSAVITVVHQMARWHAAAGGRTRVLVAPGTWDGFDDNAREEVAFRRLGTPPAQIKAFDRVVGGMFGRRPLSGRSYIEAAVSLGADFDGVVFVYNEPSAIEVFTKRCPTARVCLWVQNELFRTYTKRQARRVVAHAHRVICCSEFIARSVERAVGTDARVITVLNGIDTDAFVPPNILPERGTPVVLFIGRLVPVKGVDLLLRAARMLDERGVRGFRVRIVGSSNFNSADALTTYEQQLRELAAPLGERVEFRPFVDRKGIVAEYQAASIFCMPSNWDEPLGLTMGEAMACGLPVVASRRGGISEVGADAALYFDPPDVDALARQLDILLSDQAARSAVGRRARTRAEQLSWSGQYQLLRAGITQG